MHNISISEYNICSRLGLKLAVISDLHDSPFAEIMRILSAKKPDVICIPGDICSRHIMDLTRSGETYKRPKYAIEFLKQARELAPVIVSRGNHEFCWDIYDITELTHMGIVFVENNWINEEGICFGGFSPVQMPKTEWLSQYEKQDNFKVVLCHKPEYYEKYLKGRNIDLVLSGHAHGGQIRLGSHGLFAHGQGLFPKYTCGIYDKKLIVSRGLSNGRNIVPRINNPFEIVFVDI